MQRRRPSTNPKKRKTNQQPLPALPQTTNNNKPSRSDVLFNEHVEECKQVETHELLHAQKKKKKVQVSARRGVEKLKH